MVADYILFFGLSIVAVASALGMLISKNAVYSALNLILNFLTVAVFYLWLGAPFIALTQVTVYAGAIMVLFLFVIMLLGIEQLGKAPALPWQRPIAIILGLILVFEAGYLMITRWTILNPMQASSSGFGSPKAVGLLLFNEYLLPFEAISVLLLASMVGVIILSHRVKNDGGEKPVPFSLEGEEE
jgi:NADH-quinone oxidoreductase subunit J